MDFGSELVEPVPAPEVHLVNAALGWLDFGLTQEATAELEQLTAALQQHPDVLEVRWLISSQEKNWQEGLRLARLLLDAAPGRSSAWLHQAYSLRRIDGGGVQRAWEALLPATEKFPTEPTIAYNLSCYACQMKEMQTARIWLKRAMDVSAKEPIKAMALADADLQPLWDEIRQL